MISRSVFLKEIQKIMEVLPPYKGLSEKGIEIYYEHLSNRFVDDAQFLQTVNTIITTQRDFPRIADFVVNTGDISVTAEDRERIKRAEERMYGTA